ncbi:hypothetical protein [Streptomyces sp. Z26]|uniref:hypothetical protein n=1 Tax=Streptomyces TaxID=1883 RepID=UPI000EF15212|nr:hypothetical protein [Streptomyces sp. Z26]RLL69782.1 hypothetical protein D7M15_26580 [Streptomyces sp. Z26]
MRTNQDHQQRQHQEHAEHPPRDGGEKDTARPLTPDLPPTVETPEPWQEREKEREREGRTGQGDRPDDDTVEPEHSG